MRAWTLAASDSRHPLAFVGGVIRGIMSARKTSADPCGCRGAYRLAIVTKDMHRQVTRESRTDANSPWRMAMSSDLTELGQEAIAGLQRGGCRGSAR